MTSALDQFADQPVWVNWRSEQRKGKSTKVPYSPLDHRRASSTDASTWGSRQQAARDKASFDGVGIVLAALEPGRHLGGIDLDACIDDEGDVAMWAREIVELVGSYTEVSPSGHGLKLFFIHDPRTTLDDKRRWRKSAKRPAATGGKDQGIEFYLDGRYFTVTEQLFETFDTVRTAPLEVLERVQVLMEAFAPQRRPKSNGAANDHPHPRTDDHDIAITCLAHIANDGRFTAYSDWIEIGMAVHDATGGSNAGLLAWSSWTAHKHADAMEACAAAWKHFKAGGGIGIGTLIKHARDDGFEPYQRRDQPPPNDKDEPTREDEPDVRQVFELEVKRLAKLDMLSYQRERKDIANKLKVSVSFLDKYVEAVRNPPKAQGLPEIVPWDEAVDGAALLDDLAAAIARHVGVPTRGEEAVALWILHSHCLDAAQASPRLAITSPTPECGKSTLLRIIGDLVPRKLTASNITAAATFRAIEKWSPTLLIDEADTFLRDNDELRGVLNSGHSRAEAFVVRTVGDNHEPQRFGTWCAVVIAMIGKLPDTLASRSIHIELQRLSKGKQVERYHQHKTPYADLARQCTRWAADNVDALRDAEPDMEGITNRRGDNWRPLFAIADQAGGTWPARSREAVMTLNHVDAGQTVGVMLLDDMRTLMGDADRISSATLARELGKMEGRRWPEFGRTQKAITANAIARLLRPFNVFPQDIRDPDDSSSCKGYRSVDLAEPWARYLS